MLLSLTCRVSSLSPRSIVPCVITQSISCPIPSPTSLSLCCLSVCVFLCLSLFLPHVCVCVCVCVCPCMWCVCVCVCVCVKLGSESFSLSLLAGSIQKTPITQWQNQLQLNVSMTFCFLLLPLLEEKKSGGTCYFLFFI